MTVKRFVVRPSCRKKMRWPRPHSGAVRNSSPPAPPCETLSASEPMWCTSMSLYRFAVALERLDVKLELVVVSDGVWQTVQPIEANSARPLLIDVEPPGVVVDGVGGASRRMNMAKATVSLITPAPVPLNCVRSSGVALTLQLFVRPVDDPSPGSGRSCPNSSFDTPCSTR